MVSNNAEVKMVHDFTLYEAAFRHQRFEWPSEVITYYDSVAPSMVVLRRTWKLRKIRFGRIHHEKNSTTQHPRKADDQLHSLTVPTKLGIHPA